MQEYKGKRKGNEVYMRIIEGIPNDYLAVEGKMVKSRWFQAGYMVE